MYEEMPEPDFERDEKDNSQYLSDEADVLVTDKNVTFKTFIYLIIAVVSTAMAFNLYIKEKQENIVKKKEKH